MYNLHYSHVVCPEPTALEPKVGQTKQNDTATFAGVETMICCIVCIIFGSHM